MLENRSFTESVPKETKLWRYMDFTKFVSLISTRQLIFPRADMFDDPYEGVWPLKTIEGVRRNNSPDIARQLINGAEHFRKQVFVSCWHMNAKESAAMWDLYLSDIEGVAIQTDVASLEECFEHSSSNIMTTKVSYLDYDEQIIPPHNMMYPYMHKRTSFEHEKEYRAIISEHGTSDVLKSVEVDLSKIIKRVYISPKAPSWFSEVVRDVLKQYDVATSLEKSSMYSRPTY